MQRRVTLSTWANAICLLSPNVENLSFLNQKRYLFLKCILCLFLLGMKIFPCLASTKALNERIQAVCPNSDYNVVSNKQMITLTSEYTPSGGSLAAALDGSTDNAFWIPRYQDISNKSVMRFQFPSPTVVTGIEAIGGNFLRSNATYKIRGSQDGSNWTDVTAVQTYSTSASSPAYGAPSNSYKFPVTGNATAYIYYEIYGVSYQTWYDWIDEFYFETQPPTADLSNVSCNDATTLYDTADDYITFDLNPNSSSSGTYSVVASGGAIVTPSSGNFGSPTSFRLQDGSAGNGNVTLTITDNVRNCDLTETITDPGSCLCPADTDGDGICDTVDEDDDNDGIPDVTENAICSIDYNITANKQLIDISTTASIGGSSSGNPRVLLDGNLSATNYYYNGTGITDRELVRLKFPKPTVLTGLEYYIGNSFMLANGAVTIVQGSNDATSWTDVSPQFIKTSPNNTPGVLSSAAYAQTFLWSNSTPYLYYRLYGVSGNANQNPWVYELFFRTDNSVCDLDLDGIPNELDLDSDNDGIPDNVEGQPTLTYTPPNNDTPAQYLANNGINSAYGTGLVPPNYDGDFCDDFLDIDTDNDGTEDKDESGLTLTGSVGNNGFDNGLESADDYTDVNGNINDPSNDLASANPGVVDAFYRKIPAPGGVETPTATVNGVEFKWYQLHNANPENGAFGEVLSTGYLPNLKEADDPFLGEDGTSFHISLTSSLEITSTGNYTFQFVGLDDNGAVFINGTLVRVNNDAPTPINLTTGMHQIEVVFSENSGGERCYVQYSGPDTGNNFADIPDDKLWINPKMSAWYKSDLGVTGTEGINMTKWEDQSSNANDLTGLFSTPKYYQVTTEQLINYNPVVEFPEAAIQGQDHSRGIALGIQSKTVFTVFTNATNNGSGWLTAVGRDNNNQSFGLFNSGTAAGVAAHAAGLTVPNYFTELNIPELSTGIYKNNNITPSNNIQLYGKGKLILEDTRTWSVFLNDNSEIAVGSMMDRNDNGNRHNGKIAEVIHYPWDLSDMERQKVESYLAIKYGISLDTNYIASDGTTIWNTGSFDNDIAGIGKDILSGLDQKQSKSASGNFFAMGLGVVDSTNVANTNQFAADKTFTIWGHNGAVLDFANLLENDHKYASRLWKLQETGTVDSVEISIHINDMRGTVPMLIRSTDATIDASDDQVLLTLVGDYYKGKIDFNDGDYFTFAQEPPPAPGGVTPNLTLWLKADKGITTNASENVSLWEDQSGVNNHADLIFSDPQRVDGGLNFNPILNFDGNDYFRFNSSPFTNTYTAAEAVIIVKETAAAGNHGHAFGFGGGSGGWYTHTNRIYDNNFTSDRVGFDALTGAIVDTKPGVASITGAPYNTRDWNIYGVHSETNNYGIQMNGDVKVSTTTNTVSFAQAGGNEHLGARSGAVFTGDIAEIFLYDRVLSTTERQRVNTYAAIKYGLPLKHDYIASDGTTVLWDYTTLSAYNNDIAGIGRDDATGLNQKQSQSQTGQLVTMSLGTKAVTNSMNTATFPVKKSYELWGHNGLDLAFVNPLENDHSYASRIWIVKETGTVGTVEVSILANALRGTLPLLIRSMDGTIDASDEQIALTQSGDFLVATVDFNDGDYFTFAQEPPPAPGGVSHELGVWLKADSEVYSDAGTTNAVSNSPVQQWNTQSGTDHTTQTNASQKPIFKDGSQVEAINFNPGVFFDGSNDELHFPSRLGVTGTNNFTIFAAGKLSSTGAKRIFGPASSASNAYEMDVNVAAAVQAGVTVPAFGSRTTLVNESFIAFTARDGNTFSAATNGEIPATGTNTKNFTSSNNYDLGSSYNQNPDFHGTIGEFVVYQGAKTSDDIQKIQSYLALKYGATLDTNYVASNGTTIWSKDSIYNQAIAGIGYDKAAGLLQKQSWSTIDTTIAIGLGNIFQSNPLNSSTFDNNLSFLVWGSNGATTTIDTAITPLITMMKRVWKVANIQSIGNVVARVHGGALGVTDETPIIIVSTDEIIDENDTIYELIESNGYYKGPINLPNDRYFSIGLKAPQPLIIPIKYSKN